MGPMGTLTIKQEVGCADNNSMAHLSGNSGSEGGNSNMSSSNNGGFVDSSTGFGAASSSSGFMSQEDLQNGT